MKLPRSTAIALTALVGICAAEGSYPAPVAAQIPGVGNLPGSLIPDKTMLLDQAKKLIADLTAMKQDSTLAPAAQSKADALLPQANAVSSELAKPQLETSRLPQLASQLGDLQKQAAALKGLVK